MSESMVLTHKWQEQGLGEAPFRAVAIISMPSPGLAEANTNAYNNAVAEAQQAANRFGVMLCSCNSCGQSLQNNVVIRDSKGKHFVVGIDCAGRTGDSRLITETEALERARQKALREARYEAERLEREARIAAAQQEQRDRNGGLTDYEMEQKARQEAEAARRVQATEQNRWLLDVLARVPYSSDFVMSMIRDLEAKPAADLSDRCLAILGEIYAKTVSGARKNSKAYKTAEDEFWAKFGE